MKPTFDAHVHLWQRQWEDCIVGTARSGPLDQCNLLLKLMEKNGIERACVIAACNAGEPDNNEFVADLCRTYHGRFVMLSEFSLLSPHRDKLLAKTIHDWPAAGFRYIVPKNETPEAWSGPDHNQFWKTANDAKLCVALNLAPHQIACLPPLIERYPDLRWLIDHMGRPRFDMPGEQYRPVLDLAAYPNVFVKVSGFYAFTANSAEYPYADLYRFVLALRDAFGPRRLMWASDYPPVLDYSSYEQSYTCLQHIPGLTDTDRTWLLGQTAHQLFK
jgi:L-fuconolactonase